MDDFFANKYYVYTTKGNLNKNGFDACYLQESGEKYIRRKTRPINRELVIQPDTTVIRIGQKNREDKLRFGLLDPIKGKEVLPIKYVKIDYKDHGRFITQKEGSNFVELIKMKKGKPIVLIPEKYEDITIVDIRTALVKQGEYWFLYNIERQKCLEVEFSKYERTGIFLHLQRFGLWSTYNLKTHKFDLLLGDFDEALQYLRLGDWLSYNYSEYENMSARYMFESDNNVNSLELFNKSDLSRGRLSASDEPAVFFHPNNINFKISVAPRYRVHARDQYLLYQDDKGFHLVDTSGQYTFQNKSWEAAILLGIMDGNKPYCLILDEKGAGLWNPIEDSIQYIQVGQIGDTYRGNVILEMKLQGKEGYLAFPKGAKQPFILAAEYDEVHDMKVMRDGTCIAKVTKDKETYWVDEDGNWLSNCKYK
ncbi:MAG: hypothetical protein MK212_06035 [Saprospiraceae bacterium]|nr:hypothetical protein [Saprospiraceae bacterium]